jgi:23S rRNA-/tRNA-specific pseudouridylate synthase
MQILFSNQFFVAIQKPPGIAVHGAPGPGRSLVSDLRDEMKLPDLTPVHRLDKDASGVLLFARGAESAAALQKHWANVSKEYWVLCEGVPAEPEGVIDALLLENPSDKPERMNGAVKYFQTQNPGVELPPLPAPKTCAVHPAGRASQTKYSVRESFGGKWSLLAVQPQQGRMHQIRVHLTHAGCPLAVDSLYGKRASLTARDLGGATEDVVLARMPLHAAKLTIPAIPFVTPALKLEAPLPDDLQRALEVLRTL